MKTFEEMFSDPARLYCSDRYLARVDGERRGDPEGCIILTAAARYLGIDWNDKAHMEAVNKLFALASDVRHEHKHF